MKRSGNTSSSRAGSTRRMLLLLGSLSVLMFGLLSHAAAQPKVADPSGDDSGIARAAVKTPGQVLGYIDSIPRETRLARTLRLRQVEARRNGLPLLVHRGATTLAPENTLEAYALSMDYGADGVEIDIHRTADGVLYLMHDDTLDRTTTGSGRGREMTYHEILQFDIKGAPSKDTRVPTLAAFLQLARERAMLIHLDVKQGGIQDDIERMIEEADMWDHIVECNAGNAEKLRNHPKVRLMQYKGWIPERKGEPDMDAVRRFLEQDGNMVFCKDIKFAAKALGRTGKPVPLSPKLRKAWSALEAK